MTSIGRLQFFDGAPTLAPAKKVYDSHDVCFGPKAPQGFESNQLETIPGKGWFVAFRNYGPLRPWFDETWIPGGVELAT